VTRIHKYPILRNYALSAVSTVCRSNKGIIESVSVYDLRLCEKVYSYRQQSSLKSDENDLDLLTSIKENGLLYPLLVTIIENQFQVLAGRRRLNACKKLGWRKVLCNIVEVTEKEAYEISLIENIHVHKIDPLEEAEAFKKYVFDYGWGGISELSSKISKSKSYIVKRIKLLNLPENAISYLDQGLIAPSIAEELLSVHDKGLQSELAELIREKRLSKSRVRNMITNIGKVPADFNGIYPSEKKFMDIDRKAQRSFEQAITALRLAMTKISSIAEENEENWIMFERLMHHKILLHQQIDLLLKDKRKL
jgi:ParB family chromosome partitioning protein